MAEARAASKPRRRLLHRGGSSAGAARRAQVDEYSHLSPVSGRMPFREYVIQLAERRHFMMMQAWSHTTTQHRGMILGNLWLVLSPALDAAVYFLIFGIFVGGRAGISNFFAYIVIGIFMFSYTSRMISAGLTSIHGNRALVKAFTFPRATLPLAAAIQRTFGMVPVLLTMFIGIVAVPPHEEPHPTWLLIPILFFLQGLFGAGWAFAAARLGANFPDARNLISFALRIWMYGSAVIFSVQRFDAIPAVAAAVRVNPMYHFLVMYRGILMDGEMPEPWLWMSVTIWSLASFIGGLLFFWSAEVSYGRHN